GQESEVGGQVADARSQEPGAGSQEPEVGSQGSGVAAAMEAQPAPAGDPVLSTQSSVPSTELAATETSNATPDSPAVEPPSAPPNSPADEPVPSESQSKIQNLESEIPPPAPPRNLIAERAGSVDIRQLAEELGVGTHLLRDILNSLTRPALDPRDSLAPPVFRRGIMKLEDLAPGMELSGTVLNVVDFGVFVDIGLSDSGLVHISRLADRFIRDPHEVVGVGDVLKVWVVDVDKNRRRVSLTAIAPGSERPARQPRERQPREKQPRSPQQ